MSKPISWCVIASVFLSLVTTIQAKPLIQGPIKITPLNDPKQELKHGYAEHRFAIDNTSDRAIRVRMEFPGENRVGQRTGLTSLTRTFVVEPTTGGRPFIATILQPAGPAVAGFQATVWLDGGKLQEKLDTSTASARTGSSATHYGHRGYHLPVPSAAPASGMIDNPTALVLHSQRVSPAMLTTTRRVRQEQMDPRLAPGGGFVPEAGPGEALPPAKMEIGGAPGFGPGLVLAPSVQAIGGTLVPADGPPPTWSDNWLAYSRFDAVILTTEDLDELVRVGAPGQLIQQALFRFAETGGTLIIFGPGSPRLPASWKNLRTLHNLTTYPTAFGNCFVSTNRNTAEWPEESWEILKSSINASGATWRAQGSNLVQMNEAFKVVDDVSVPVLGLFVLIVFFSITIGPVNLALLTKWQKRIWLLWTVPLLSAIFSGAVLGYMVIAEGWTGHSRIVGITILDEGQKRATTLAKVAFYTPLTPSDGLRYSLETEVTAHGDDHPAFGSQCALNWGSDQHLAYGWVTARVPCHFLLRKSETSDAQKRLNPKLEDDGKWSVLNGLGVDIRELYLADDTGAIYKAESIETGARATLTRTPNSVQKIKAKQQGDRPRGAFEGGGVPGMNEPVVAMESNPMREAFRGDWARQIETLVKDPTKALKAGTYVAVVEASPFVEPGMKYANRRPSASLVVGIMDRPKK
jgi:hypothetical protein